MTVLHTRKIYKYKKGGNSVVFCGSVYILDTTPACINTKPLWLDGLKYSCRRCCLNILKHHDYTERGVSPQITRSHVSYRTLQEQTALWFQVMSLSERAHFSAQTVDILTRLHLTARKVIILMSKHSLTTSDISRRLSGDLTSSWFFLRK